ncbi:MAG: TlpA disulfide reductase family protein, partial [Bacteroidota bacterium]
MQGLHHVAQKLITLILSVSFEELETEIAKPTDKIKVINFWATWCKPCIEEMPYFDAVARQRKDEVVLYFVSMDFKEELTSVIKFVDKRKPYGEVMLLDDINYDAFMPKIDPTWSGAIPATLFVVPDGKHYFYEKSFSEDELSQLISGLF